MISEAPLADVARRVLRGIEEVAEYVVGVGVLAVLAGLALIEKDPR